MCIDRILDGINKIDRSKGNKGGKTQCGAYKKREKWVSYLLEKKNEQNKDQCNNETRSNINSFTSEVTYSGEDITNNISNIITTPNESWMQRKASKKYRVPRCFND